MRVVWSARSLADRRGIGAHLAAESPAMALRVVEELVVAGDSLADFPHRGRPGLSAGTRELVAVPPFIIIYQVLEDRVRILRLWHAARLRG